MQFFKTPNINFVGNRKTFYIVSIVAIAIGLLSIVLQRGFNPSIDFAGGTVAQLAFEKPVVNDIGTLRQIVNGLGLGNAEVKTIGGGDNEIQITVKEKGEGSQVSDAIRSAIAQNYSQNTFEVRRVEIVGPRIGRELVSNAITAVLLACVAIAIYVAFRFKPAFGVGAVTALVHDVLIVLGGISLLRAEMSLTIISAILTVVGYSINDTIVVFDRVRERMSSGSGGKNLEERINSSINETLSRTLITSVTLLFALVVTLVTFYNNNETIRNFCLSMIIGVVTGTYSSIFVASSIVVEWNKKWALK